MKTRPILFSTDMVKAILDGRKTQTRRIVKPTKKGSSIYYSKDNKSMMEYREGWGGHKLKPKALIEDVFWVRESFFHNWFEEQLDDYPKYCYKADFPIEYEHDGEKYSVDDFKWKPSIHMPKEACRLFLKVTNVRVERLQGICEKDTIAEGIQPFYSGYLAYGDKSEEAKLYGVDPKDSFELLWTMINGKKSWKDNPWVWVYDFEITERPENFLKAA
ncbi:hypothetical protein [Flagellimonas sp.]|uniref:hypothetical protein n=1 Tax=Flagellimonas sp. TaxID=2058762 RepID=UPI003BA8A039